MTLCTGSPAERSLERYMQGTLPELEARSFEEHYFDCPVCLAQVEALQAVTAHLAEHPALPKAVERPTPVPKRLLAWPISVTLGAIAAALAVGFVVLRTTHPPPSANTAQAPPPIAQTDAQTPAPATTIASLADLSLPPFQATRLRGEGGTPAFDAGMKSYTAHDCPNAIRLLSRVPPGTDEAVAARFYTAACTMQTGSLDQAATLFQTVEATGGIPQKEAALFYLAQIALARQDASTARRTLTRVVALRGDFAQRARAQLDQLP